MFSTAVSRRDALISFGALGAGAALAGCSSGKSNENIKLNVIEFYASPSREPYLKKLISDYMAKNPNVTINLISPPTSSAQAKYLQLFQAGSGIDVLEAPGNPITWANNGWVRDIQNDIKGWSGWDQLTPAAQQQARSLDGRVLYLPYGFFGHAIFYRKDKLAAAGFSGPPTTWEDLFKQAGRVNDPSKSFFGWAFRGAGGLTDPFRNIVWAYQAPDVVIDKHDGNLLKNGRSIWSGDGALEAATKFQDMALHASPPSSIAWGYPEQVQGFQSGQVCFLDQTTEVIDIFKKSTTITTDQWDTCPMPLGPGGKSLRGMSAIGWSVAKSSKYPEESLKFIQYLTSDPQSLQWAQDTAAVPAVKSAANNPAFKQGAWKAYVTMDENPQKWIVLPSAEYPSRAWGAEYGQMTDDMVKQLADRQNPGNPATLLKKLDDYLVQKYKDEDAKAPASSKAS